MAGPKLAPNRYIVSPPIPQRMLRPPPPPEAAVAIQLTPNIKRLAISRAEVTGASCSPKIPENLLLSAASEKRRFAPHSWHRVALMPTSAPHAGHIFGRGCCSPPPKNPRNALFHFSTRICH